MSDLIIQNFVSQTDKIWADKTAIRKLLPSNLSDVEFDLTLALGRSLGANPFTREIWAIKFGQNPAQIFCGRDFYRRKAQQLENYNGHHVDAIYSNDKFSVVDGKTHHEYNFNDRGILVGAYCLVHKKGLKLPYFVSVKLKEYDKQQSVWKSSPETMIKKVAEAQALRGAFQGVFGGTYDESEQFKDVVGTIDMTESAPVQVEKTATLAVENRIATLADIDKFWIHLANKELLPFLEENENAEVVVGIRSARLRSLIESAKSRKILEDAFDAQDAQEAQEAQETPSAV